MRTPAPSELVTTLDPSDDVILKREERTVVWRETRPDGTRTVVKLYRRRGRLHTWRSSLTRFRAEREYRRLLHLSRWDVPCTAPLAWAHGRSERHGYHEILVMREVSNCVQLAQHLKECDGHVPLTSLYRTVRRMHESGFCNQTLYAYNVLVSRDGESGDTFFLSDVPRSWTFPRSIVGTKMALFDLLDLTLAIEEAGVPAGDIPLEAYGLDADGMEWWMQNHDFDSRKKRKRLARDGAARLRWTLSWARHWRSRARAPVE